MPPDYSSSSSSSSSSSGSYPYSSSSTYAGNDANIRFSKPSYPLTPPSIYQDIPSNISSIPNPYLPPTLPSDAYPDDDDFRIRSSRLNSFLYFATIKYFTTAFVSPFEVAKILLQVQYLPDDETIARQASSLQVENENALGDDELSEHDYGDSEGYSSSDELFTSPSVQRTRFSYAQTLELSRSPSDSDGYLLRKSIDDITTRPSYMLPPLEGGVWDTVKTIAKHKDEGYMSLWKGQFTNWLFDLLNDMFQPSVESVISESFDLYDDTIPLIDLDNPVPNLIAMVASHAIVGVALSPLEIVRTRLIIQPTSPHAHSSTKPQGFVSTLRSLFSHPSSNPYLQSHHLIPSILYHTVHPLIQLSLPLIIDRIFGVSPVYSPGRYMILELLGNIAEIGILLPIETVRRRLMVIEKSPQIQETQKIGMSSCVDLRPIGYSGFWDCFFSIIREEGGTRTPRSTAVSSSTSRRSRKGKRKSSRSAKDTGATMKEKQSWWKAGLENVTRVGGLYKGFGMHAMTTLMVFVSSVVTGLEDDGDDF